MRFALSVCAAVAAAACAGGEPRHKPPTETPASPAVSAPAPAPIDASAPIDAGPPMSEAVARQAISARFRAVGFRVRHDVRFERDGASVTLDGYDPRKDVGFEYIAPSEIGADLAAAEAATLSTAAPGILVVKAGTRAAVLQRVDQFLAATVKRLAPDAGAPVDAGVGDAGR